MAGTVRLEDWSVKYASDSLSPYTPPELRSAGIAGEVYGHPRFEDGERVTTSGVVAVVGRTVLTQNTEYELGAVSDYYRDWLRQQFPERNYDFTGDLAEIFGLREEQPR